LLFLQVFFFWLVFSQFSEIIEYVVFKSTGFCFRMTEPMCFFKQNFNVYWTLEVELSFPYDKPFVVAQMRQQILL